MKLYYYRHPNGITNFGDELNPWLWDRLLDGVLDDDPDTVFFGIGTLLRPSATDPLRRLVVMGSGTGYFNDFPKVDKRWTIYCLRGPLTAASLNVDPSLAVTDPAYLVRTVVEAGNAGGKTVAYMPHLSQADKYWSVLCPKMGLEFIDPRDEPGQIIEKIGKCRLLVSEALHGAIVADALGVPWIPVTSSPLILDFKWRDWMASVGLDCEPAHLPQAWLLPRRVRSGHGLYDQIDRPVRSSAKWAFGAIRRMQCALALKRVLRTGRPVLADRKVVNSKVEQLQDSLERFKQGERIGVAK